MISYMHTIQKKSLHLIVCMISVKLVFLTFDLGSRSKVIAPNERPYMISYMYTMQQKSLSLIVCKIYVKRTFLTFDLDLRSRS